MKDELTRLKDEVTHLKVEVLRLQRIRMGMAALLAAHDLIEPPSLSHQRGVLRLSDVEREETTPRTGNIAKGV